MKARSRIRLGKIAGIVVLWTLSGFVISLYDALLWATAMESEAFASGVGPILFKTLATGSAGLLAGAFVVLGLKESLRRHSVAMRFLIHLGVFAALGSVLTVAFTVPYVALLGYPIEGVPPEGFPWVRPIVIGKNALVALVLGLTTSIGLEMYDRIGRANVFAFLVGRYGVPRTEERCFLFLDLADSTGLAERLGHRRYFELLNAFFSEVSEAILETAGEIYQYVGDEIVVSWSTGRLRPGRDPIACVSRIRELLRESADGYLERFDAQPRFRCGIHVGPVTVGEVGVLKKEQVFSGDTLNVTARILESCKEFDRSLLFSGGLRIHLDGLDSESVSLVGKVRLRGKAAFTELFTLRSIGMS